MDSKTHQRILYLRDKISEYEEIHKKRYQKYLDEMYEKIDEIKNEIYETEGNMSSEEECIEEYKNELRTLLGVK